MKAVPILILTNVLALGLVLMLYVKQDELSDKLESRRVTTDRTTVATDPALRDRLARLEAALESSGMAVPDPAEEMPSRETVEDGGGDAPTATMGNEADATAGAAGTLPEAAMDKFRGNVREAMRLNAEEDRTLRVVEGIDGLIKDNRIAPLTDTQKKKVATAIMKYRGQMPTVWRKLREEMPEGATREDRRKYMTEAFEDLRAEVQTDIEGIVPAADAKVIVDTTARGGMGRGMPGGGRGRGDR